MRAVFLDRDGVLMRAPVRDGKPYSARTLEEVDVLPGVAGACAQLRDAGYLLVMVTNQPEIARGIQTLDTVDLINRRLREQLALDDVRVCPHDDADGCVCRKPKPGMLLDAATACRIDLVHSVMVGDRWRDVEAGTRAGCHTIYIDYGYSEKRPSKPDLTAASLAEAIPWILQQKAIDDAHP